MHGANPRRAEVVFLDKSARPVAWLVRSLWRVFARQPETAFSEGCAPRMPGMHFANIDREQWWSATGASETGAINLDRVPLETVAGLRGAFLREHPPALDVLGRQFGDRRLVGGMPSFLDDARILVVDEVSNTGDTLAIASGLISRAFPTSQVAATHWMSPGSVLDSRSGQSRTASVPAWYRSDTETGRLIGNRLRPGRGTSWRGDVGHLFLSTIPLERDLVGGPASPGGVVVGRRCCAGHPSSKAGHRARRRGRAHSSPLRI